MSTKKSKLIFPLKGKYVAMVAPSFVTDFSYPSIIAQLKKIGFDKVVELTFGAKMINREYHKELKKTKNLKISSACPGVVSTIVNRFPQFKDNLLKIDSPMIAMGKICRKSFPEHKIVFISPCDFKKIEAKNSEYVDYVLDYDELKEIFKKNKIKKTKRKIKFDKFYNDYTKIFPLSGALAKTAHLKGVLKKEEIYCTDGILNVIEFLKNPNKKIKFLDCLFCEGGCIGGPHTSKKYSLRKKKKKLLKYLKKAKKEDIPECRKGIISKAKDLKFSSY
jgi:iron only hydrogenase large subunit-like protein